MFCPNLSMYSPSLHSTNQPTCITVLFKYCSTASTVSNKDNSQVAGTLLSVCLIISACFQYECFNTLVQIFTCKELLPQLGFILQVQSFCITYCCDLSHLTGVSSTFLGYVRACCWELLEVYWQCHHRTTQNSACLIISDLICLFFFFSISWIS